MTMNEQQRRRVSAHRASPLLRADASSTTFRGGGLRPGWRRLVLSLRANAPGARAARTAGVTSLHRLQRAAELRVTPGRPAVLGSAQAVRAAPAAGERVHDGAGPVADAARRVQIGTRHLLRIHAVHSIQPDSLLGSTSGAIYRRAIGRIDLNAPLMAAGEVEQHAQLVAPRPRQVIPHTLLILVLADDAANMLGSYAPRLTGDVSARRAVPGRSSCPGKRRLSTAYEAPQVRMGSEPQVARLACDKKPPANRTIFCLLTANAVGAAIDRRDRLQVDRVQRRYVRVSASTYVRLHLNCGQPPVESVVAALVASSHGFRAGDDSAIETIRSLYIPAARVWTIRSAVNS